ncbi:MAG: hypothetical protein PHQ11_03640 [Paludibacter sp.]|nr:hypothetical protein [Paludibacter sp.]MDD4428247.1 hypothetical protein [Paludibacter sp.]
MFTIPDACMEVGMPLLSKPKVVVLPPRCTSVICPRAFSLFTFHSWRPYLSFTSVRKP